MARSKFYYDKYSLPPLKNQFRAGYSAFKTPYLKTINGATVIVTANPYPNGTMQNKEWQRGYDTAYFNHA